MEFTNLMPLLQSTLQTLESEGIRYCILRDGEDLGSLSEGGELDMLLDSRQIGDVRELLKRLGFVELPSWGHRPHHFFVAYMPESDGWLKLDVVTRLAYGRPSHNLDTDLGETCLSRRQLVNDIQIPSSEDEFVSLLFHCILDKRQFPARHCERLRTLRKQISDTESVSVELAKYMPLDLTWQRVAELIDAQQWQKLADYEQAAIAHFTSKHPIRIRYSDTRDRLLRKLNRSRNPGLSVAVLAPDGAGKSTLVKSIEESFFFATRKIYMGLYQKTEATGPKRRPAVRIPGVGFTKLMLTQWGRYLSARYHRARGRLVLFDRYTYDAFLPPSRKGRMSRLRRRLLGNACPGPDLIVLLNAPGSVLYARKKEHSPEKLEDQRQSYLAMQSFLPQMVVVDATEDPKSVCRKVTSIIWGRYSRRYDKGSRASHCRHGVVPVLDVNKRAAQ
jgi:thymidylate kinase